MAPAGVLRVMDRITPPAHRRLKVSLLEESELVVQGLRAMLEPHAAVITLVPHRAGSGAALSDLTLYEPSVHRPVRGELSVAQKLPSRLVAYGWDCSPEVVSTEMARGAVGFVSKWVPARRLVRDLLQIAEGRVVVDAWTGREPEQGAGDAGARLTPREAEVLAMIASGRSNRDIADQTHLSINSVKSYIRGAYAKIEVTSRSQAVLWAIQHGLLVTPEVEQADARHDSTVTVAQRSARRSVLA